MVTIPEQYSIPHERHHCDHWAGEVVSSITVIELDIITSEQFSSHLTRNTSVFSYFKNVLVMDLKYIFPMEEFKMTARGEMWKT